MQVNAQPLVTVLTPVYNGEKYLAECIESILAQTYTNWEYLIIQNCSTDRTPQIAKAYAEKEPRIRVVTNPKLLPALENHNVGVRHVSPLSKYCKIVHAPDWLFPDCLTKMVEVAEEHPTVGLVGAYSLRNDRVICDGLSYPSMFMKGKDVGRAVLLGGGYAFGTPTTVLYASEMLRGRDKFFNEANFHADLEACFDVLRDRDFGFVHQVLTYSRVFPENASRFDEVCLSLPEMEILFKYGRDYLSAEEFAQETGKMWDRYYTSMGSKVFRNKRKEFWSYHRMTLNRLGFSLNTTRIAKAVLAKVLDISLNPLNTSIRIARRMGCL